MDAPEWPDMADEHTPTEALVPVTPVSIEVAKPKKRRTFSQRKFVPVFVIKLTNGTRLEVPQDSSANQAAGQIMLAQIRAIFGQQLDLLMADKANGITPRIDAATLKDLMNAADKLTNLSQGAYGKDTPGDEPTTALGKMAAQMVGAAAQGLAQGASSNLEERMRQIEQLGKKVKNVTPAQVK